jgi:glc operon protein GlcG
LLDDLRRRRDPAVGRRQRGSPMASRLGLDEARAVVEAVLTAAAQRNLRFAAAVVDSGGELIYLARMDGASPLNARMAMNKAYTATKWLRDTKAIKERLFDMGLGDDRRDIAWFGDPRFTAVWGGILLRSEDGTVLGALGEGGGTPAEDEELGQLGAQAFAAL